MKVLTSKSERAHLMWRDTAEALTRLFFIEQSLIISQAGWVPALGPLEGKVALCKGLWEDSVAGNELRKRILELRYPRQDMNEHLHNVIVTFYDKARHAPNAEAFILSLAKVLKPALRDAYQTLYDLADRISDGPSVLILKHALSDLTDQLADLNAAAEQALAANPASRESAEKWVDTLSKHLDQLGGSILETSTDAASPVYELEDQQPFQIANKPIRDAKFIQTRFYWPHIVDPDFPSGEGIYLQMRSAIGHLNEVWAAESVAVSLYEFADKLGWDYIMDMARWTYDEMRHCLMGYNRLLEWGFKAEELPVGDYIFTTVRAHDPLIGLGMIHYFETKYIHRGRERINTFSEYQDTASLHDYEFDWADETFHAEYGRRWIKRLFELEPQVVGNVDELLERCDQAIAATIATATDAERQQIRAIADKLLRQAEAMVA